MANSIRRARIHAGIWLAALAALAPIGSPAFAQALEPPRGPAPPAFTLPDGPGDAGKAPPGFPQPAPPAPPGASQAPGTEPRLDQPPSAENKTAPGAPEAPDTTPDQHVKLLDELYTRLATAPDPETANEIASAVEQLWLHSGSPTADLLVARASAAIEAENRDLALQLLTAAVELQPDYVEAWNRRAYLFYLEDDFNRALGDLRRVLALDPRHYKALEGLGNLLRHLGEKKAALEAYNSVLKIHPNLPDVKKARDELVVEVEGQGI
ncbi:MAG: tetratricopeptide repeat protein [Hyphomicrobium sp.]|uniref:tetratricopeptide repeat protein n=1 Tax=Hyphomicrobium sp. TaxID=82 RepID=UPI003D0D8533